MLEGPVAMQAVSAVGEGAAPKRFVNHLEGSAGRLLLAWSVVGLMALTDIVWLAFSRFALDLRGVLPLFGPVIGLAACYPCFYLVRRRTEGDPARIAGVIRLVCDRACLAIHAMTFAFLLFASVVAFTYLSASLAWPFQDVHLAMLDRLLRFDWLHFLSLTNAIPGLPAVLVFAYKSSGIQLLVVYLVLGLAGYRARLAESCALLAMTSLLTVIVNWAVPAAGAYVHYAPAQELFSGFSEAAGVWHYDLLLRLRLEPAPPFDLARIEGLVTFPSFHTALAILTTHAVRGFRYVFPPVALLNTLVIIATLPEGGHHLVDLIAGASIAVGVIALLRLIAPVKRALP
jgi:PAP2 superfamily